MNRITSIVFDLDGTLYINRALAVEVHDAAIVALALQLGIGTVEAEARLAAARAGLSARTGLEATLSAGFEALGGDVKALHEYLAGNVNPEKYLERDDRVAGMLRRLAREYGLYIYTNNNRPLVDRILCALGLEGLFAGIISVEDFWRPKPDRLALAKLFAAIGAEPVECLFAGDRYDVDLRLPEEHGSRVLEIRSIEQLLSLEEICKKKESGKMVEQVKEVLETVRPALQADGGDVELVEVTADGVVKVKLVGACGHCPMSTMTLKMGIERTLKEQVPGVTEVVQVR